MKLIAYLNEHFLTREELLARCGVNSERLDELQRLGAMPQASYRLHLGAVCESYFGRHEEEESLDYYARGYASWLGLLQAPGAPDQAFEIFAGRYRGRVEELAAQGLSAAHVDLGSRRHLASEWQHFLAGTYGLCTVSGLPEDIAAKELASAVIGELTAGGPEQALTAEQRQRLVEAVGLLDRCSAPFAPHERARSSRARLVERVRRDWRL